MKIKTGPEIARLFGCWCPPPPQQLFQSLSIQFQAYTEQFWSIPIFEKEARIKRKKKKNKTQNKRKPKLQPYSARTHEHTRRGRCKPGPWGENAGVTVAMSQVIAILLGAASPTALLRPGHHPAGRILAGKTGVGAEERAGAAGRPGRGRSRRERGGSSPGNTVHATGSQRVSAVAES